MKNEHLSEKQLLDYISRLRQDIETLKQEKADLEIILEVIIDHGDLVETQLRESQKKLKAEIEQHYLAQLKLEASQEHLQSLVTLLSQEKIT